MDIDARYELLEKVGAGSFATVYRARDLELGREVAVKQIHIQYLDDPKQLSRYWQEAQLLASLQHPNIVTIFDIYRERGWLIMELMQANLADRLHGRQIDLRALRAALAHSLRALKYLHSRGIIHGDVKPGNMMIDARRRVKLGDFGLARRVSDEEGSLLKGTTKYMAPETVSDEFGQIGPASDLYSLGFSAYELMCGPNFESLFPGLSAFGRNKQIAWMMWHAAPDRRLPEIHRVLEGVPADLARVVQKLCEKEQSRRYGSADEALADLNADTKSVRTADPEHDDSEPPTADDPARRKRLLVAGGAFLASLILCVVLLFLPGGSPDTQQVTAGTVLSIDVDERLIKLEDVARTRAVPLSVPEDARLSLEEGGALTNILLSELRPGDRIEYEFQQEDGRPVMVVRASRPVVSRGWVRDVNLQDSVLRVSLDEAEGREELRLRLPENTDVFRNLDRNQLAEKSSRPARERLRQTHRVALGDVRPEDRIEVAHLPELGGRTGRVVSGALFVFQLRDSSGRVAAIESAGSRAQMAVEPAHMDGATIDCPISPVCRIVLRDNGGTQVAGISPSDIRKGDLVEVKYDTEFREIIVTRGREAVGAVREVLSDDRRLVVSLADGATELAFAVAPQTRLRLAGERVELDDLRQGDRVTVLYDSSSEGEPVAGAVSATRNARADRWAVAIGVRTFDDKSLARLPHATADADLIATTLRQRYALKDERLITLHDPARDQMQREIAAVLRDARADTQVLVYLSTHGFVAGGRVYLAGRKFDSDRIAETGLPLDWLVEQLQSCRSKDKLLLLDCSHEWAGPHRNAQPSGAEMLRSLTTVPQSTVVIAGCDEGQRGRTSKQDGLRHGVFARHVARGFAGRADADRNLHITPDELFEYLKTGMAQATSETGTPQAPVRLQGE